MGNSTLENGAPVGTPEVPLAAGTGEPGGADPGKGRPGRKTREEEVAAYLAEHGLITVPGQPGAQAGPEMASVGGFDENRTRVGVELIVEAANSTVQNIVEGRARPAVDTDEQAKAFGERARMAKVTQETVVSSAVELCREKGVNIGPEYSLGAALLQWGLQVKSLIADLNRVAALKARAASPPPPDADKA